MNIHKRTMRSIAAGIIVIFFVINIIPCVEAGNIVEKKNTFVEKASLDIHRLSNFPETGQPVSYILSGTKGENDWYISCVTMTFTYNPSFVKEIYYYINNWQKYQDVPINICDDGGYNIPWYWIDQMEKQHNESPIYLKIDQTPPEIKLTKKTSINGEVTFTATVTDDASKVEYVEFYLDDELQETLTEAPYKWVWTGEGAHPVYSIAYNGAGLSQKSDTISTPRSLSYYPNLINIVFEKIYNIIFWIQQSI